MTHLADNGETQPDGDIQLTDISPQRAEFLRDVLNGLGQRPRTLPCKYLYDERGSILFDQITECADYYPTRTEREIFERRIDEIVDAIGPRALLYEPGSGNGEKARYLLSNLKDLAAFVPVEISRSHLEASAAELAREFPDLPIYPVCADFTQPFDLPELDDRNVGRCVCFFPGSTIGNFTPEQARSFLADNAQRVGSGGAALIGADLWKDEPTLKRAYDDSDGVTAAFNLNLLARINRELDADFDLDHWSHDARVNHDKQRVEMHLVSGADQSVTIDGERFDFTDGETIHTENSHKFTPESFASLADQTGWRVEHLWTDDQRRFSLQWLIAR